MSAAEATRASQILGREAELAALRADLASAMQGAGRLVLLSGEAGIGKTTLATAHSTEALARGALVVWGRCQDVPGAPAYWPWLQILDGLERAGIENPESDLDDLRALLPDLRTEPSGPKRSVDEHARFELFARVARMLSRLSEKRGLVLVVDDLHSADASSRRLLRFLAGEITKDPILLVATLRTHEPASEAILEDLARHGRSISIGPLERDAIEQLLAERLPQRREHTPGAPERQALVEDIIERTQGNPFFVLEMAQLLSTRNESGSRQALPASVKTVVERRLSPLSLDARAVLQAAATIGQRFDFARLSRVVERSIDSLYEVLAIAIELGIVVKEAGRPNAFAFAHALTRETLYEALGPREASDLHGRVGEAIEAEPASPREAPLSELSHHFFEAADVLGSEKLVRYALEAGHRALARFAYDEAALQFERAVTALGADGDPETRMQARLALAQALLGMGERERAEMLAQEARELAAANGSTDLLAEAVDCWCAAREEIGVVDVESVEALEATLRLLGDAQDPGTRARLTARLASALYLMPGTDRSRRELNDAAAGLADRSGSASVVAFVQLRRLTTLLGPDSLEERLALLDEMLAAAADLPIPTLNALTFLVDACAERCDRDALDETLQRFEQKAQRLRHPHFTWTSETFKAALALLEGRYDEAETKIQSALTWGLRVQQHTPMLHFAQQMFMLRGWQNRLEEVLQLVQGSAAAAAVVPAWRCALADLYRRMGRLEDARREYDAVAQDDFASLPNDTTRLTSLVLISGMCVELDDVPRAKTLYRMLAPYSGRAAVGSPLTILTHSVDSRLGTLATVLRDFESAERHFEAALAQAERMRALTWQADNRYELAVMCVARGADGDTERAEALLAEAETTAEAIGMELLLEYIRTLRARVSAAPVATRPCNPVAAGFQREGDIWSLTFEGRVTRLKPLAGLGHLHRLLEAEGAEVHVLDLVGEQNGGTRRIRLGDSGEVLDEATRAQYQARLRDLDDELAEAERMSDRGRIERAAEEREALLSELARGFGLGGRARREGSPSERARVSVTRAIKYALGKIAEHDPDLAQLLERDVKTGTYCRYAPVDRDRVDWTL